MSKCIRVRVCSSRPHFASAALRLGKHGQWAARESREEKKVARRAAGREQGGAKCIESREEGRGALEQAVDVHQAKQEWGGNLTGKRQKRTRLHRDGLRPKAAKRTAEMEQQIAHLTLENARLTEETRKQAVASRRLGKQAVGSQSTGPASRSLYFFIYSQERQRQGVGWERKERRREVKWIPNHSAGGSLLVCDRSDCHGHYTCRVQVLRHVGHVTHVSETTS